MTHPEDALIECQMRLWLTHQLREIARVSAYRWKEHAGRKRQRDESAWFEQQVPLDAYPNFQGDYTALSERDRDVVGAAGPVRGGSVRAGAEDRGVGGGPECETRRRAGRSMSTPREDLHDILCRFAPLTALASLVMEAEGSVVRTALPMQLEIADSIDYPFGDLERVRDGKRKGD